MLPYRAVPKFLFFPLIFLAIPSAAQPQTNEKPVPAGVSIAYFSHLDSEVYSGSKPRSQRDFEFLKEHHIRYIANARFLPFLSGSEKKMARKYGITLLTFFMNASPIPPSRKHVDRLLLTLHDKQFQPIYVHCVLGRDRTSLISGLYKIYFLGVSKHEALKEMKATGFRNSWFVHGLTSYFNKQAGRPPAAVR